MTRALLLLPVTALLLTGCSSGGTPSSAPSSTPSATPSGELAAQLVDPAGASRGSVSFSFADDGTTTVSVEATGLPAGLHGFHVHAVGRCEPDSPDPAAPTKRGAFLSAGGHVAADGQRHGDHDGDLPPLLVRGDGSASLVVTTDRLPRERLLDADGSAVMVHAMPDNLANVPERYAPQLDETTTKTGDAGGRIACAAVPG